MKQITKPTASPYVLIRHYVSIQTYAFIWTPTELWQPLTLSVLISFLRLIGNEKVLYPDLRHTCIITEDTVTRGR